ncbi:lethal(3)malignant brain tumor-like protein 3 isoform X2 [Ornithodoros turicata]|uniref:lethal(3)malignant brain tumor-like protein 3 isoform X2 n=1 Tax=Ornithodoros turicata TaxID=34597 RepID=UPI0031388189
MATDLPSGGLGSPTETKTVTVSSTPPLVGSLAGSNGAVINLAFANADLVQRAAGLPLPQQVTPQVATITLTRDLRNDIQLNSTAQKPIIVTVSGLPGLAAGSRSQLGTPISISGQSGVVSIATTQAAISGDKVLTCPVPAAQLGTGHGTGTVVVTTMPPPTSSAAAVLVGKPGSFAVFPASQSVFGTALFAPTPVTTGTAQPFGTVIAASAPSEATTSVTPATTPTSTVTMAVYAAAPATTNVTGTSVTGISTNAVGTNQTFQTRLAGTVIPGTTSVPVTTTLPITIPCTIAAAPIPGAVPVSVAGTLSGTATRTIAGAMTAAVPVSVAATVPASIAGTVPVTVQASNVYVATDITSSTEPRSLLIAGTTGSMTTSTVSMVSSVPTPIAATITTSAGSTAPTVGSSAACVNGVVPTTTSTTSAADPANADFDPIQAMDWKDGIATLPGSNLKFRLTEFGTLEVVSEEPETPPTVSQAVSQTVKIAPKVSEPESPLKAFVVPQYTAPSPSSVKEEIVTSQMTSPGSELTNGCPEDAKPKEKGTDEIICCQFCSCHGLRSEFVRDGHFCGQLCYVNYTSRERIKRKEEIIKKKKRKVTPNGEEVDDSPDEAPPRKEIKLSFREESNSSEAQRPPPPKPKCKPFAWSEYLEKEKVITAPAKLFKDSQGIPIGKNGFRVGMKLEAIDPRHQAMFCVVTVAETVGYRLRLHFDGYSDSFDFWTNADSPDIFPAGWCERTNHVLQSPKGYNQQSFNWNLYLKASRAQAAPKHLFACKNGQVTPVGFRVGMKLEAVDKRQPGLVCVATVADLMEGGRFLVHFDGLDGSYDYWADPSSPYVHPIHWCRDHNCSLTPPSSFKGPFSWEKYLVETKSQAVPGRAFKLRVPQGFRRGMRLEAVDPRNAQLVRVMSVSAVQTRGLVLHMDGWSQTYDFFVEEDSQDIHPAGWCAKTGHPLEPPPDFGPKLPDAPGNCPTPGCTGVGHIKGPKFASHHSAFGCPYSELNMEKEQQQQQQTDRLGNTRNEIMIDIVHVAQDTPSVETTTTCDTTPKGGTVEGLRRCPTPGCNGSGHLNQKYSVHHKASGCPLAGGKLQVPEAANGDDSSQDSMQATPPSAPRGRGRPRKNKTPTPVGASNPKQVKNDVPTRQPGNGNDLHNCVHQSVFCGNAQQTTQGPSPPSGPEKSLCWEQHSKLMSNMDLVSGSVVTGWSVSQVATFVCSLPGCQSVAKAFRDEQIDGEAFLLMNQSDLVRILRLKLGPALKIYSCILKFRSTCDLD